MKNKKESLNRPIRNSEFIIKKKKKRLLTKKSPEPDDFTSLLLS